MRNRIISSVVVGALLLGGCVADPPPASRAAEKSEVDPRVLKAYRYKGRAYLEAGNDRMAVDSLERARQLAPRDGEILAQLGEAYIRLDQPAQALAILDRAAALRPKDGAILNNLGAAHWAMGSLPEAERAFQGALAIPGLPRPANTWFNLARIHQRLKQDDAMEKALVEGLKADPLHPSCLALLSRHYRDGGRLKEEQRLLRTLLTGGRADTAILERLAASYRESGQTRKGRAILERIVALDPDSKSAQRAKAKLGNDQRDEVRP